MDNIKTREELHKEVMKCLVANGIYRGIKFLFLCHIEDNNTIIDAIKMADMEHDAIYDVDECIGREWIFCRNREDAQDHADRMWDKSKL